MVGDHVGGDAGVVEGLVHDGCHFGACRLISSEGESGRARVTEEQYVNRSCGSQTNSDADADARKATRVCG